MNLCEREGRDNKMEFKNKDYNYEELKKQGTGSHEDIGDYKFLVIPFDRYEVTIKLTQDDQFVAIVEIGLNKDFLSHKQKITFTGYHDVEKFYKED